jgi:ribosomal protein L19
MISNLVSSATRGVKRVRSGYFSKISQGYFSSGSKEASSPSTTTLPPLPASSLSSPSSSLSASSTSPLLLSPTARLLSFETPTERVKTKNAFKRASNVMTEVKRDALERMDVKMALQRAARIPPFRVGDAVEVSYAMESSESDPTPVRGTVLGKWNRGLDSKFTIINNQDGEWYTASYVYSSPLLKGLKVMQKSRWSDGLKRSRRAKLTNLLAADADPNSYSVDASTKEAAVLQAEKEERRALQRAGKVMKKKSERAESKEKEAKEAAKADKGKGGAGAAATAGAPAGKGAAPPSKAPAKAAPAAAKKK